MTTNSLSNYPTLAAEHPMTTINTRSRRQRAGIVKLITSPTPPDENTVRKLNALAGKRPFCNQHKVKKHDTL